MLSAPLGDRSMRQAIRESKSVTATQISAAAAWGLNNQLHIPREFASNNKKISCSFQRYCAAQEIDSKSKIPTVSLLRLFAELDMDKVKNLGNSDMRIWHYDRYICKQPQLLEWDKLTLALSRCRWSGEHLWQSELPAAWRLRDSCPCFH